MASGNSASRWKHQERQVALDMGGKRIPNNGFGQPDVDHPKLSIQVKTVKSFPVWFKVKWDQTKRDAEKIGKVPFLAICHAPGAGIKVERVAVIPIETARAWYDAWEREQERPTIVHQADGSWRVMSTEAANADAG